MVISAFAKQGNAVRAEHWLRRMEEVGLSPDVMSLNAVIDACARAGQVERAEHWLQRLLSGPGPNIVSFSSMLHACARRGGWVYGLVYARFLGLGCCLWLIWWMWAAYCRSVGLWMWV